MAELVARLQATAGLWIDSRHLLKIQNGNISTGVANKLKTAKKYKNKTRTKYTDENFKTSFRDRELTINAPLILKMRDIIYFLRQTT